MLCILRGGDEPRLPPAELDRILKAGTSYRKFMKKRPSQLVKATTEDMDIRLVLDLQVRPLLSADPLTALTALRADVPSPRLPRSGRKQHPSNAR